MKRTSIRKRQQGVALLVALFALMLLSAIGLGMMYATNTETLINANYRDKQGAQYGSMSGVQEARDRIQPLNVVAPITAPTALPLNNNNAVIYIINPKGGETVAPWNTNNPYFDTELCQENVLSLTGTAGVPCTTIPSGNNWYATVDDSQSSSAPWNLASPLSTKWTRITRKANNMGPIATNGTSSDSTQLCWNGTQEIPLPSGYVADNCGPGHYIDKIILTNPGTGYSSAPVVHINGGGGSGATATADYNPVPDGQIGSISVNSGGSGYTIAPTVSITGGGGTGATATATIYNPGAPVASLNLASAGGQCYASAPTVSISGGGGSGAAGTAVLANTVSCLYALTVTANCAKTDTITITTTGGGGSGFSANTIATSAGSGNFAGVSVSIINPGTGYTGAAITAVATGTKPQSQPCTNVSATPTFGYRVSSLSLTSGGAAYGTAPTVSLGGGIGSGVALPTATATLGTPPPSSTTVTSVTVTNPGSGYTTVPTVTFNNTGTGGSGAVATATIANQYVITGVTVTNGGSGYDALPTISFTGGGGGTGAAAYATVNGVSGLTYGMVYQLTSLAQTSSGARAMTQMEVATPVRGLALTGALTLDGPAPVVDALPNSSPFYVDGHDYSNSTPPTAGAITQPAGCNTTPGAAHPAVGAYDDPNASPPTNSVSTVVSAIPSGRTSNYLGSGPSPDVQNVYGALGDTMSSPSGLWAFDQAVRAAAGPDVYTSNPSTIDFGSAANPAVDYVDGDLTLNGANSGYGILVVTGTLTMGGNFSWNGLVLAIGDGIINFGGGGNGQINGSVIVAKIWDNHTSKNLLSTMGSPTMSWNGGGGNGVYYDHCWADGMLSRIPFLPPPPMKQLKIISTRSLTY